MDVGRMHRLQLTLVEANLLRALKRLQLPDVGHRIAVRSRANGFNLVQLIIQDQELLPLRVKNPSLASIQLESPPK
jgi:hypothetical protein